MCLTYRCALTVSNENSKIRGQTQTKPSSLSQINGTK